jgi:hypothetical protein
LGAEAAAAAEIDTSSAITTAAAISAVIAARAHTIHARLRIGIAGVEASAAVGQVVGKDDAVFAADGVATGAALVISAPTRTALAALVALAV